MKPNGFVKTPEDWDELTEIVSGSPEAIVAAHMGWNLACKYHNQMLAEMTDVLAEMKETLAEMKGMEDAKS